MLAFWFLWPWLEMMAPGATERGVTITWIAGQVEHTAQMIGALALSFHNYIYLHEFFLFALDYFLLCDILCLSSAKLFMFIDYPFKAFFSYSYSVQNISLIVLNLI